MWCGLSGGKVSRRLGRSKRLLGSGQRRSKRQYPGSDIEMYIAGIPAAVEDIVQDCESSSACWFSRCISVGSYCHNCQSRFPHQIFSSSAFGSHGIRACRNYPNESDRLVFDSRHLVLFIWIKYRVNPVLIKDSKRWTASPPLQQEGPTAFSDFLDPLFKSLQVRLKLSGEIVSFICGL